MTATVEFAAGTVPASVRPRPAGRVTTSARGATTSARRVAAPARRPVAAGRSRVPYGAASCVAAAPQPVAASSAVQLTRRGWTLLLSVATAVAAVLVWVAFLSHPGTAPGTGSAAGAAPTQVVVQSGDTLWSIASRVAPDRDPRAVVFDLQQANHLDDPTVVAGQVLRVG